MYSLKCSLLFVQATDVFPRVAVTDLDYFYRGFILYMNFPTHCFHQGNYKMSFILH
jgi:hypothetical protein